MIYFLLISNTLLLLAAWRSLNKGIHRAAHQIRQEIRDMSTELDEAIAAQNAAIENLQAAINTETVEINAKLDELQAQVGTAETATAVNAIRASADRLNAMASAVSAIVPDEPVVEPAPVEDGVELPVDDSTGKKSKK